MRVVGIIAECNPFHDGHAYLIQKAKELCGANFAVVILNGDFVQRGEPAIFDKYTRTRTVLEGGADLVFELPVRFGVSSAGDFALGGVMALNALGFVTDLCFGSECGNLPALQAIADILINESTTFKNALRKNLSGGLSYPLARARALEESSCSISISELMQEPNNILGIEYCIALKKTGSSIEPHTIQREGMAYHSTEITFKESTAKLCSKPPCHADDAYDLNFPSATSLRKEIISDNLPHLCLNDFSEAIGYALLSSKNLSEFKDISDKLALRFQKYTGSFRTAEEFVADCKTRAYTESRIRRGILQCMLKITEETGEKREIFALPYLRLLGMKKSASGLLTNICPPSSSCHILSRLAVDRKKMSEKENALLAQDIFASDLYRQTWCRKYHKHLPNEYQHSVIVV